MDNAKKELRQMLKRQAAEYTERYLAESNGKITEYVLSLEEYKAAKSIFAYCSIKNEPDTYGIINDALACGKRVSVPLMKRAGEMDARIIRSLYELTPNSYGIPEPPADAPVTEEHDLILVPALAADKNFHRLGKGGGYYDRYLAAHGGFTVCLVRGRELFDVLPTQWNDVALKCTVTDNGIKKAEPRKAPHAEI